jgi:PrtD family type I secretion system ABC transporter
MAAEDGILSGARPTFVCALVFSLFSNVLVLAIPLFSLQVYDRVMSSRSGVTLTMLTLVAAFALLVHAVLEAVRSRLMVHVGLWLERVWAPELLRRSVRQGPDGDGATGARVLRDLATVRNFITGPGIFHLFDAPWVPVYAVVMFILHPDLGWLTLGGGAVLFGLAWASEVFTREPLKEAGQRLTLAQARADEYVRRADVIEAMGMLPGLIAHWATESLRTQDLLAVSWHRSALLAAMARFGRFGVQIGVVAVGAWLCINDNLSLGSVVAASILLTRALAPVESLVGSWKNFIGARAAHARVREAIANHGRPRHATSLPAPVGRLSVDRIEFELPHLERPVLTGIDMDLTPGESLGIIGPSAAGKSTLARIILGIQQPSRGRVRLDGADMATWPREDLGRHIGYLPQAIQLFPGTIKRNIARMTEPDDCQVIEAAKLAGVHEMILRLPLGYDTEIADALMNLSGGQRQRIAIARAFYGEPRLLILDEPNSNLDADGENALIRALEHARGRGVTTIVIAHRARVLMSVDRLMVLREGRMDMLGARDDVLARVMPQPQPQQIRPMQEARA